MSEWQPIEIAPKDGEQMLLWDGGIVVFGWFDDAPKQWAFFDLIGGNIERFPLGQEPTHWIPLPEPPDA